MTYYHWHGIIEHLKCFVFGKIIYFLELSLESLLSLYESGK